MKGKQTALYPGNEDSGFWLIPPEIYRELDAEFHFTDDPCPFPRPPEFDGLTVEWGRMNWVNPPFVRRDGSPTAWVRKAIVEQGTGRSSVLVLSCTAMIAELLSAGAEFRYPPGGMRIPWLHTITRKPMPHPGNYGLFILRGKEAPP